MLQSAEELGTIVGVWAHPDDEAYLSGGLMADLVRRGERAVCVTATRGEAGFPPEDPRPVEERTALRTGELEACLGVLGVREHHWLDYPDGACADVAEDEPVRRLAELLDDVRPDSVLTFGPDGMTGHLDHAAVGRWTTLACTRAARPVRLLYATKTSAWNDAFLTAIDPSRTMMDDGLVPPVTAVDELAAWFSFDGELLDRKVAALGRQASQTAALIEETGASVFRSLQVDEYFRAPRPGDHGGAFDQR